MQVFNAQIVRASISMNQLGYLMVNVSLETQKESYEVERRLSDPKVADCLERLMQYTNAKTIEEVNGKIIRLVISNNKLYGFAHPIKEAYVPLFGDKVGWQFTPTTFEEMLEQYLKKKDSDDE